MDATYARLGDLVSTGRETDQAVKDAAYRAWVQLGRSWRLTSERTGVAVRTLHNWADADGWQQRRADEAAALLPGALAESAFALRLAAHNASMRLQQIAFDSLESGTKPDHREVQALRSIVELGGVALGKLSADAAASMARAKDDAQTSAASPGAIARLSPEDRQRLAAKLLAASSSDDDGSR